MNIKSKFIYFTGPKYTCDIIKNAFARQAYKFAEDNNYGIYYWFNYYSDIWGRMLPHVFEVIYTLVKREEGKQYPNKWFEDMKDLPVMRVRIAPASKANERESKEQVKEWRAIYEINNYASDLDGEVQLPNLGIFY